jgi:uncharacterized protein
MIFYYLDSSAWVKRYYEEIGSDAMQELFGQEDIIACSPLGYVEVTSTLVRKHKANEMDAEALRVRLEDLNSDWVFFFKVHLTPEVLTAAMSVAREMALRGADAVYLASALVLQGSEHSDGDELILVTSDRELQAAAERAGLPVIDPSQTSALPVL